MQARYTLQDANALVPLMRSIAAEVDERRVERRRLARLREQLETARSPEGLESALGETDARLFEVQKALNGAVAELDHLGLTVLRLNPLTVHIPGSTQRGDIVFCWQVGEQEVLHGHKIGEEDDPRRPLQVRVTRQAG